LEDVEITAARVEEQEKLSKALLRVVEKNGGEPLRQPSEESFTIWRRLVFGRLFLLKWLSLFCESGWVG
jgi:hypothetical protein